MADEILLDAIFQGLFVDVERSVEGVDRAIDILVGVRVAHDQRGPQHAASDQLLKQQAAKRLGLPPVLIQGREDQTARPADHLDIFFQAVLVDDLLQPQSEPRPLALERFDLALAIDANNAEAKAGQARALQLDKLLKLMDEGSAYEMEKRWPEALEIYKRALETDPEWPAAKTLPSVEAFRIHSTDLSPERHRSAARPTQ